VKRPVKFRREEDAEIMNGTGDEDPVGRVRPRGEKNGGRGRAETTGAIVGRVKEHELRLVEIDRETHEGQPGANAVPGSGDFGDGGEEGGARSEDATIVDVERQVDVLPVIRGAEERGSGKGGENRREGGALRSPLIDGKRVRRISIKGEVDGAVGHEAPHPVTRVGIDTEAGEGVDGEGGV